MYRNIKLNIAYIYCPMVN